MSRMSASPADPAVVLVGGGRTRLTTDCCHTGMSVPGLDLVLSHQLLCISCGERRKLDIVSDPRMGMRAVWSDPPDSAACPRRAATPGGWPAPHRRY